MVGEEELEADAERNNDEVDCDIDNGDGTGKRANAKDRESLGQDVENATHVRAETSGTGQRERDAARRAPENHRRVQRQLQDSSSRRAGTAATPATGPGSSGGTSKT